MNARAFSPLIAAAMLAACAGGREQPPAPVVYQGTQPGGAAKATAQRPSAAPRAAPTPTPARDAGPDSRGVIYRDGYETIMARSGDSVDSMAARVGLSGAELAAYNGLSTLYAPSPGDELVLPPRAAGYTPGAGRPTTPPPAAAPATTVASAPAPAATQTASAPPQSTGQGTTGWSAAVVADAIAGGEPSQPQPTTVAATAELPRQPQPAAPEPAPIQAAAVQTAPPAPEPPAQRQPAQPVQSAAASPTEQIATPSARAPASPTPGLFVRPVNAPVSRPFSKAPGPDRNDGVDFASPAGMEVKAAADGTVALVSRSLGGLGTIVLIRHQGEFLTVYGRVDGVAVTKGDKVVRGQSIARVAELSSPRTPSLHFEVRRGADSVDPEDYL